MDLLLRFIAIANLSLRRLVSQRGMAVATLAGIITSIALVMSIPMYADAAYQRILEIGVPRDFPRVFDRRHYPSLCVSLPVCRRLV